MSASGVADAVDRIKSRISVIDVAARLFPGWKAGKSCCSPFRQDANPSFSVYDNGRKFKDHATSESGDAIDFYCRAKGCDTKTALMELASWAGVERPPAARKEEPMPFRLPPLRQGTAGELGQLSRLRNLSIDGLHLAAERGLLHFAELQDQGELVTCWLLTDSKRISAQARRLDGGPLHTKDGRAVKAKTLPGSAQSWPVGLPECEGFPNVLLCEGGPDLLAAHHFIVAEGQQDHAGAVAMLGASNKIPAEALPMFKNKAVRVFPHLDESGQKAAVCWETQLRAAGADVHCFSLAGLSMTSGEAVADLNDLTSIDADQFEAERDLWALASWKGGAQ